MSCCSSGRIIGVQLSIFTTEDKRKEEKGEEEEEEEELEEEEEEEEEGKEKEKEKEKEEEEDTMNLIPRVADKRTDHITHCH